MKSETDKHHRTQAGNLPSDELEATTGIEDLPLQGDWWFLKILGRVQMHRGDPGSERNRLSQGRAGAPKTGEQAQVEARGLRMV